jgi:hypothetical protein
MAMKRVATVTLSALLGLNLLAACAPDEGLDEDESNAAADDGKFEAWDSANNPASVDNTFIYEVDQLPLSGKVKNTPWAGDYWATANDSINVRWDGSNPSAAEKAGTAFSLTGFPQAITDNFGIMSNDTKSCSTTADCASEMNGSDCVRPRGVADSAMGRCVPGWWGICHGWSPAAISEPAPKKSVELNGVTFYPGDLEGLMSLVYSENLPSKFLSRRCNRDGGDVGLDNTGRPREGECRDMNPGSFHVIATNFLGLRKQGFVEDRTYDAEVWNQPVEGYEITNGSNGKLAEITKEEAIAKLGGNLSYSDVFTDATLAKAATKEGQLSQTGTLTIRLTGSGDADLYVKKNSAPTASDADCTSNGGSSDETCEITLGAGDTLYYMVLGYADSSKVSLQVGSTTGSSEYIYNSKAKRWFYVEMDFHYISEASPEHTVADPAQFTQTDSYQYILETDADGRIIGGEWVGASQTAHPDFVWWPTDKPYGTLPGGLTYAMVKGLFDKSADEPTTDADQVLLDGVKVARSSKYFPIGVPGGKTLTVTMTGSGNADLYLRMGRKPTVSAYDKASTSDTSSDTVSITAPQAGATYYVRVRPTRTSTVTVKAQIR